MAEAFTPFDAADYLTTAEDQAAYLEVSAEDRDLASMAAAFATVARAQQRVASSQAGVLSDDQIKAALSFKGLPYFAVVARVARAMDLHLTFRRTVTRLHMAPARLPRRTLRRLKSMATRQAARTRARAA